jgi:hypothetical protein
LLTENFNAPRARSSAPNPSNSLDNEIYHAHMEQSR